MAAASPTTAKRAANYAAALTSILSGESYAQSTRIAATRRPVRRLRRQPRAVPARDRQAPPRGLPHHDRPACRPICRRRHARCGTRRTRSASSTATATRRSPSSRRPGTIAFMMDCDTTGIEPDIALVKYKKLVGGGMLKIVNQTVPSALKRLGYDPKQVNEIIQYIDDDDTIEGAPHVKPEHLSVFDCAFKPVNGTRSIHYMGHLRMMGAVQPFISGRDLQDRSTCRGGHGRRDRDRRIYEAWKLGLKAVAVYRDGCKRSQPLSTGKRTRRRRQRGRGEAQDSSRPSRGCPPQRRRLPIRARVDHPQVLHRRPRGLHHRRPLPGRHARRDLPEDGQGRLDDLRA